MIDSHGHLTGYGKSLEHIDLVGTKSYQEVLDLVREKVEQLNQENGFAVEVGIKTIGILRNFHHKLSEISPNNPVILSRIDGHAILVNQKAMEIAEINETTTDPDGGKILEIQDGIPSGIFIDNAEKLITDYVPKYSSEKIRRIIENAANHLRELGLTGVGDAGIPISRIDDYKYLIDNNKMPIRINAMLTDTVVSEYKEFLKKYKLIHMEMIFYE